VKVAGRSADILVRLSAKREQFCMWLSVLRTLADRDVRDPISSTAFQGKNVTLNASTD
jgi:hypothetical protein